MAIKDNLFEIENVLAKYKAKLLPVVKNRKIEEVKETNKAIDKIPITKPETYLNIL